MKRWILVLLVVMVILAWVISLVVWAVSTEKHITAREFGNGWVMGYYAANPDKEIVIVDTIYKIWYVPPNPYVPAFPSDYTLVEFVSTSNTSGTFRALMIQGDLTETFEAGDKVIVRFTVNQFIAGIPQTITPLPASSIHKYSEARVLSQNLIPFFVAASVTVVVGIVILVDRVRMGRLQRVTVETVAVTEKGPLISPTSTVYCRFCGAQIPGDSVYCEKCGKKR